MDAVAVSDPAELDRGSHCLVLVGAPGAGKSTLSRAVAGRLTRAAVFSGDDLNRMIVSGWVFALAEPRDEAERQVDLTLANLVALARNFMAAGFTPVIETIFATRGRFDALRDAFGDRLLLVVLDVDDATCRARNRGRPEREQFVFDGHAELRRTMQAAFGDRGWWLDTSGQSVQESTELILTQAVRRARC